MRDYWQPKYDRQGIAEAEADDFREMVEDYLTLSDEDMENK